MRSFAARGPASTALARRASRALVGGVCLAALGGCAGKPPPELRVRGELALGRWREAADAAGEQTDELLRHLNRGLALLYAGDPRASNLHFARAEQVHEERYTRSLSRAALSLLLNDTVLPYQPDPLERLLVPMYRALNHVAANQPEDAAVEARRLSALLLERRDDEPERARAEGDGFLAAVAGTVLQWAARPEDASVAYRLAAAIDSTWSDVARQIEPPAGEVVLLFETGFVAVPIEERIFLLLDEADLVLGRRDPAAAGDRLARRHVERRRHEKERDLAYLLPIAIPRRPPVGGPRPWIQAYVDGAPVAAKVTLDVSAAAAAAYDRGFVGLLAKTAARAVAKTLALEETTEDEGWVVRVLANALHVATERADTRSWSALPDVVSCVRVSVPAGEHAVRVRVQGAGRWRTLDLGRVDVPLGGIAILHARSFDGGPAPPVKLTADAGRL